MGQGRTGRKGGASVVRDVHRRLSGGLIIVELGFLWREEKIWERVGSRSSLC